MAKFDISKVMWTTEEADAASAADAIFEAVAAYVVQHSPFTFKDVPGLLLEIGKEFHAVGKVVAFCFKDMEAKAIADRLKDLLTMLERDNDWLNKNYKP